MRYFELLERRSAPMKTKELESASQGRTIGFEFEMLSKITHQEIQNEEERMKEEYEFDEFVEEWWDDQKHSNNQNLSIIIESLGLEPTYGFVSRKEQAQIEENKNPEFYQKVREIKNKLWDSDGDNESYLEFIKDSYNLFNDEEVTKDYLVNNVTGRSPVTLFHRTNFYLEKKLPYLPEEFDSDEYDYITVYDKDGNIVKIKDLESIEDLKNYFSNQDYEKLMTKLEDKYNSRIKAVALQNLEDNPKENVKNIFSNELSYNVDVVGADEKHTSNNIWGITHDLSIGTDEGVELISPVFTSVNEGISELDKVLNVMKNHGNLVTTEQTGLHINIGNIDRENFDFLKFLLFIGENDMLKFFDRQENSTTSSLLDSLYFHISRNDTSKVKNDYYETINYLNDLLFSSLKDKFNFVNIEPLKNGHNFIEIRGIGGKNYESKKDSIIKYTKKIAYALDISEDPEKHRDVYLKKLAKIINDDNKVSKEENFEINVMGGPLSQKELEQFINILKKNNISVLFIKHHLERTLNANMTFNEYIKGLRVLLVYVTKIDTIIYRILYKLIDYGIRKIKPEYEEAYRIITFNASLIKNNEIQNYLMNDIRSNLDKYYKNE